LLPALPNAAIMATPATSATAAIAGTARPCGHLGSVPSIKPQSLAPAAPNPSADRMTSK
jgi:hypothetical protein